MKLTDVLPIIQCEPIANATVNEVIFTGISTDSRQLKPGELFIALKGEQFDAHDFITDVADKNAAAVIVERQADIDLPQLVVADTRIAYAKLAAYHRQQFDLPMVAITGSLGKTTTREMLTVICKQQRNVLASIKSYNNDIGVPYMLCQLGPEHDVAVLELGADKIGEIAYTVDLVKPDVAIITCAAEAHLASFKDLDTIAKGKGEILAGLVDHGTAILNRDDHYFDYWREQLKPSQNCLSFGVSDAADIQYQLLAVDEKGYATAKFITPQGAIQLRLNIIGKHHLQNAAAAIAAACALDISLDDIKQGIETMPEVYQRLVLREGLAQSQIIDDSYNAIPDAMKAALHVLADYPGKRIAVLGDMREIGDTSDQVHASIGELARELKIDDVFSYGEHSAAISRAFGKAEQHYTDDNVLLEALKPQLNADVTVLIKGSRGMKMETIVAGLMEDPTCYSG